MKQNIIKHIQHAHRCDHEEKQCVNVTYGADEPFLYGTGISIASILMHNTDIKFHFHIFTNTLSTKHFHLFEELATQHNTKITFYILDDDVLRKLPTASKSWNHSIYFRLIALDYFSDHLESIIYLDSDIICKASLKPLLEQSFCDATLIAVHDKFIDTISLKGIDTSRYFNSGFLYFNLHCIRTTCVTDNVISIVTKNDFTHPDQDALNIIFNDCVKIVDHRFNSFFNIDSLPKGKRNKFKITQDAIFIHYVGVTKPWHDWAQFYNEVNYFKEAKENSPWRDMPLQGPTTYKQLSRKSMHLKNNDRFISSSYYYMKYMVKKYLIKFF